MLEDHDIAFEHLPSGIDTMCIVVSTAALENCRAKVLSALKRSVRPDSISIEDGLALLAVVGRGMVKAKGTAAHVFDAISNAGINIRMIDQGSSEISIIIGVEENELVPALHAIYDAFVK